MSVWQMGIGLNISDPQTHLSQWTPAERDLYTITASQVATSNVEALDGKIDGAQMSLKVDSFEQVWDVAAIIQAYFFKSSYG